MFERPYRLICPCLLAAFLVGVLPAALGAETWPAAAQDRIIYVDAGATGAGTGESWSDAYPSLQSALSGATAGEQLWVATGIYTPGTVQAEAFTVTAGLALYGGFNPAAGADTWEKRDWVAHLTVLSGDLAGDDLTDANGVITDTAHIFGANSDHVLYLDGRSTPITQSTVIDGFTITGGQADGGSPGDRGGALLCDGRGGQCSPTLSRLRFQGNRGRYGGAVWNDGSNRGRSSPMLIHVLFAQNHADEGGGGMTNFGSSGVSSPTLINVAFHANSAGNAGGALVNQGFNGVSSPALVNVTFFDNRAGANGGALANYGGGLDGGASRPTLTNAILWGNTAGAGSQIYNVAAAPRIAYSLVQGGDAGSNTGTAFSDGPGNINTDPRFVDPILGDLGLLPTSPAVDAGDDGALPPGVLGDLAGNPRILGARVDMGAWEWQTGEVVLSKLASPFAARPGSPITFTLRITGTGVATDVLLQDSLPPGMVPGTWTAATTQVTLTQLGGPPHLVWQLDGLSAASRGLITLTGHLDPALQDGTVIANAGVITGTHHGVTTVRTDRADIRVQAPVLAVDKTVSDTTPDEGQTLTFTVTVTNRGSGSADDVTLVDGRPPTGTQLLAADLVLAPGASFSQHYQLTVEDGPQTLVNTALATGTFSPPASQSVTVTVRNVAPRGTFVVPDPVDESRPFTLTLTDPFDPGRRDTLAFRFDCGDGSGFGPWGDAATRMCPTQDNGLRAVGGQVRDSDGDATGYDAGVTVLNVPPRVDAGADQTVAPGEAVTVTATFTDPGVVDGHSAVIDWGDGTAAPGLVAGDTVTDSHTYADAGSYPVTVTVTDKDGDSGSDTVTVTVEATGPEAYPVYLPGIRR